MTRLLTDRFWDKVEFTTDCWEWKAGKDPKGYGLIFNKGRHYGAHRISYQIHKGEIPDGLQIDHLCRNPSCVNPEHLEAVTQKENLMRGETGCHKNHFNGKKLICKNGHSFSRDNVIYYKNRRKCRECGRIRAREAYREMVIKNKKTCI